MSNQNRYALKPWTLPSNYMGAKWDGWLVFLGRNRDSDLLTNHNFETALEALEKCEASEHSRETEDAGTVQAVRENHWAVGWVEWIAIHPSNEAAVKLANELAEQLDQYPILDEDRFSEKEHEAAQDAWCALDLSDRIDLIKRHGRGVSILAARHPWIPRDDNGGIFDALTRNS